MKLKRQAELIANACKEAGLDGHIKWIESKKEAHTRAEQIAVYFKGEAPLPVKNSYMFCETLDMCFFYTQTGEPQFSFSGYARLNSPDITEGKLVEAFKKADAVLRVMEQLAKEEEG